MIPVTADRLEKLIEEAENAGASPARLQQLRSHLGDIKSGRLNNQAQPEPMYKEFTRHGRKIVRLSTAPMSSGEDRLENLDFEPIQRPSTSSSKSHSIRSFFRSLRNFIHR
jgi:hypothetical protein